MTMTALASCRLLSVWKSGLPFSCSSSGPLSGGVVILTRSLRTCAQQAHAERRALTA